MNSKQKKIKLVLITGWGLLMLWVSFQLGVRQGKRMAMTAPASSLAKSHAKVETLTFFDTLHEPVEKKDAVILTPPTKDPKLVPDVVAIKTPESAKSAETSHKALPETPSPKTQKPAQEMTPTLAQEEPRETPKAEPPQVQAQQLSPKELQEMPWAVQVGAFEDGIKAVLLRKELEKKGFGAFTVTVRHQNLELYRVMVAASTQDDSEKIHHDLQNSGYSSTFVVKR